MTAKTLSLRGTVQAGKAEGSEFLRLTWVRKQIASKLGFTPFPGTLNIKLNEDDVANLKKILKEAQPIEIVPEAHFCRGKCYKTSINDEFACAILIPEVPNYPDNLIEIVSPDNLRKKLRLADGDTVEVKMSV